MQLAALKHPHIRSSGVMSTKWQPPGMVVNLQGFWQVTLPKSSEIMPSGLLELGYEFVSSIHIHHCSYVQIPQVKVQCTQCSGLRRKEHHGLKMFEVSFAKPVLKFCERRACAWEYGYSSRSEQLAPFTTGWLDSNTPTCMHMYT